MPDQLGAGSAGRVPVGITGLAALSALGRGLPAQVDAALTGTPAFGAVRRFDPGPCRVRAAATAPGVRSLEEELVEAVRSACAEAGLTDAERAGTPLFLALHGQADAPALAAHAARTYTSACVSASTAVADAAALISRGLADRIVVAAGYLVELEQFALFDAGRALSDDGTVRPFSADRRGLLLGDGIVAVVLQAGDGLAEVAGWGRGGDAYHPCRPAPDGRGMVAAIGAALRRAGVRADAIGYVNANANGSGHGDAAEATAIRQVFPAGVPVSSTKSVHGHALEASGLLELVLTVQALRGGKLPVNAGFTTPDPDCALDVITDAPRPAGTPYALTLNAAFGGANTALLVRAE